MFGIRSLSGGLLLFRLVLNYAHLTLFNKINLHSVVIHVIFVTSN